LKKQNINLITQNDALEKRLTLLENAILGKWNTRKMKY
jgi:ABC-type phosphate/phosphonate transport system ATPase subunit